MTIISESTNLASTNTNADYSSKETALNRSLSTVFISGSDVEAADEHLKKEAKLKKEIEQSQFFNGLDLPKKLTAASFDQVKSTMMNSVKSFRIQESVKQLIAHVTENDAKVNSLFMQLANNDLFEEEAKNSKLTQQQDQLLSVFAQHALLTKENAAQLKQNPLFKLMVAAFDSLQNKENKADAENLFNQIQGMTQIIKEFAQTNKLPELSKEKADEIYKELPKIPEKNKELEQDLRSIFPGLETNALGMMREVMNMMRELALFANKLIILIRTNISENIEKVKEKADRSAEEKYNSTITSAIITITFASLAIAFSVAAFVKSMSGFKLLDKKGLGVDPINKNTQVNGNKPTQNGDAVDGAQPPASTTTGAPSPESAGTANIKIKSQVKNSPDGSHKVLESEAEITPSSSVTKPTEPVKPTEPEDIPSNKDNDSKTSETSSNNKTNNSRDYHKVDRWVQLFSSLAQALIPLGNGVAQMSAAEMERLVQLLTNLVKMGESFITVSNSRSSEYSELVRKLVNDLNGLLSSVRENSTLLNTRPVAA